MYFTDGYGGVRNPRFQNRKPFPAYDRSSRSAVSGIAAAGMMFAIVAGGFDLSVGSILSLTSCVIATQLISGKGTAVSILTALAVAARAELSMDLSSQN